MKKYFVQILLCILALCCTGCVSYLTTPLTSNSIKGTADLNGPAIVDPDAGWHPYASAVYFDKQLLSDLYSSADTLIGGSLTAGFNLHKGFDADNAISPYLGAAISASVLHYTPYFTEQQYAAFETRGINVTRPVLDYSAEVSIKPGITFFMNNLLNSYYLIGLIEYENGDYAALRKRADGVENAYNLVDNAFSFGFGVGGDIQVGRIKEADIGFNVEYCFVFNKTQSVPYAFIESNIMDRPSLGGEMHRYSSIRYGPYIDYESLRVALLFTDKDTFSFQLSYRF